MSVMMRAPATGKVSQVIDTFLFVRSIQDDNAAVRIHTMAAEAAIEKSGLFNVVRCSPSTGLLDIPPRTCLVFYYADLWAIEQIRKSGVFVKSALSLCFGSDIRCYAQYSDISDIVDCFLMPSRQHANVLGHAVMNATAVVRESIDPFFDVPSGEKPAGSRGRNVLWFGYGEGFLKGMDTILGVVQDCLAKGHIDRFAAILNRRTLDPRAPDVEIIEYASSRIIEDISAFDYVILSHIPADLHVNSLIKSPNKVISALTSGLVPLASGTPNYRQTLSDLGLERFLFNSPFDLYKMLKDLDVARDRQFIRDAGVATRLGTIHSAENIFSDLMDATAGVLEDVAERRAVIAAGIGKWEEKSFIGFGDHIRGIVPSGIRAAVMRRRGKS